MQALRATFPATLVCAFLGLASLSTGCSRTDTVPDLPSPGNNAAVPVHTAVVTTSSLSRTQSVAGTVRPVDHAVLSARIMGTVAEAAFSLGQHVPAGTLLVRLDAAEYAARVAQSEAALAQLEADFARESALLAQGASTSATVRTLAERQSAAAAALLEARSLLGYTRISAPFSGTVTRRFVNPGDFAAPGAALVELEGDTGLRVELEVPATLPFPAIGTALTVHLSSVSDAALLATLAEISSASDAQSRTRLAKLDLPAGSGARFGDFARVAWPAGTETALTVPAPAVSLFGQMERVFVVREGHAELRLVKTAGTRDGLAIIAAGLSAGEVVVLSPPSALREGQALALLP